MKKESCEGRDLVWFAAEPQHLGQCTAQRKPSLNMWGMNERIHFLVKYCLALNQNLSFLLLLLFSGGLWHAVMLPYRTHGRLCFCFVQNCFIIVNKNHQLHSVLCFLGTLFQWGFWLRALPAAPRQRRFLPPLHLPRVEHLFPLLCRPPSPRTQGPRLKAAGYGFIPFVDPAASWTPCLNGQRASQTRVCNTTHSIPWFPGACPAHFPAPIFRPMSPSLGTDIPASRKPPPSPSLFAHHRGRWMSPGYLSTVKTGDLDNGHPSPGLALWLDKVEPPSHLLNERIHFHNNWHIHLRLVCVWKAFLNLKSLCPACPPRRHPRGSPDAQ